MTRIDRFKKIEIKLGTKYISVLLYLTWVKNDIFFLFGTDLIRRVISKTGFHTISAQLAKYQQCKPP